MRAMSGIFAGESLVVTAAVELLVVVLDHGARLQQPLRFPQDVDAQRDMGLHDFRFLRVELVGFEQDAVADTDLADVMEECAGDQVAHFSGTEVDGFREPDRIGGDAIIVHAGGRVALGDRGADHFHQLDVAGEQVARVAQHVAVERKDDRVEAKRGQGHRRQRQQQLVDLARSHP